MDLGATLCTRSKPACTICPLVDICQARAQGRQHEFPQAKAKKALPEKATWMLMLQQGNDILLFKRPAQGIWGGLWSLPEFASAEALEQTLALQSLPATPQRQNWPPFRHTFSHYHLDIHPVHIRVARRPDTLMEPSGQVWYNSAQIQDLGLAAPVKKLIDQLLQESP